MVALIREKRLIVFDGCSKGGSDGCTERQELCDWSLRTEILSSYAVMLALRPFGRNIENPTCLQILSIQCLPPSKWAAFNF